MGLAQDLQALPSPVSGWVLGSPDTSASWGAEAVGNGEAGNKGPGDQRRTGVPVSQHVLADARAGRKERPEGEFPRMRTGHPEEQFVHGNRSLEGTSRWWGQVVRGDGDVTLCPCGAGHVGSWGCPKQLHDPFGPKNDRDDASGLSGLLCHYRRQRERGLKEQKRIHCSGF